MVPVGDKPFLQLLLDHFGSLGFRRFVLAVSYLWEQIRDYFGDGSRFGWQIEYSVEPQPLGTGGAVLWAQNLWGARAVVANGDSFLMEDWRGLIERHEALAPPATIALVQQDDTSRFGRVEVRDGRVTAFHEKQAGSGSGWINAGVYALEAGALAGFQRGTVFSLEKDVFPALAGKMAAYTCRRVFADIGTPQSLEEFRLKTLKQALEEGRT
jgi:NDP-sugar pyrophosphorylase family protein